MYRKNKNVVLVENYDYGGLEKFLFDYLKDNEEKESLLVIYNYQNDRIRAFLQQNAIVSVSLPLFCPFKKNIYEKYFPFFITLPIRFILGNLILLSNVAVLFFFFLSHFKIKTFCTINGGFPGATSSIHACLLAKFFQIKRVSMSVLSMPSPRKKVFWYLTLFDKLALLLIDAIHVNAFFIKKSLIENYPLLRADKVVVIYNVATFPVVHAKKNYSGREFVIGTLSLLSWLKGHTYLIEAMSILKKKGMTGRCLIGGDGPEFDALVDFVKRLNLEESVFFVGKVSDQSHFFSGLDLFVFPSLHEGLPYAILEAQAFSLPVVSTFVGGIPEIVQNDVNGILVPPRNSEMLAEAIWKIYSSPAIYSDYSQKTWAMASQRDTVDSMRQKLINLFISSL